MTHCSLSPRSLCQESEACRQTPPPHLHSPTLRDQSIEPSLATSTSAGLTPSTNAIGAISPLFQTRQMRGTRRGPPARTPLAPPPAPNCCAAAVAGCNRYRHGASFIFIIRSGQMQMREGGGRQDHGMVTMREALKLMNFSDRQRCRTYMFLPAQVISCTRQMLPTNYPMPTGERVQGWLSWRGMRAHCTSRFLLTHPSIYV